MKKTKKVYVSIASVFLAVGVLLVLSGGADTNAVSSYRDCSADTIINCGAITESELLQKYDANAGDIQHVYRHYGISRTDLAGTTSQIMHGTVYQDGRVVVDGKTVATDAYSVSRDRFVSAAGQAPRQASINGTTLYEGPDMSIFVRSVDAYVYFRDGQFYRAVISSCGNPLMATPVKQETLPTPPAPSVRPTHSASCESVQSEKIDRTRYRFTVDASATGDAQVVNYTYDFGDSHKQTTTATSVTHGYTQPGTYAVRVYANVQVNGETRVVTGNACQTTVTVEEAPIPVTPAYACTDLSVGAISGTDKTYVFALTYTEENGARLKQVAYDFGDQSTAVYSAADAGSVEHTYATAGSYTTTARLYFTVDTESASTQKVDTCDVHVTINREMCTQTGKEMYDKDSSACTATHIIPATPVTPVSYVAPVSTVIETPKELPQTGMAADLLSGGVGLSSLSAVGYLWIASRKSLLSALLNR